MKLDAALVGTAQRLARASARKPHQSDLRRAVSTAYYALFHALAGDSADMLVGVGADRPDKAWTHAYRTLDHGFAKNACGRARTLGFPTTILDCAEAFVELQQARHDADYNPDHRLRRGEALVFTRLAERAIRYLKATPKKERRAFAILLTMKRR